MKIAVIAAHGRSGRAFVNEALKTGHTVHAGIRGDNPFKLHKRLITMQCDAMNKSEVTKLIDGCDTVVSLIGHVKGSTDFVQTDAIKTIIDAMHIAGIRRIVSLTGVGVGTKGSRHEGLTNLIGRISSKLGIKRFEDGLAHANALAASDLDWTVLKVLLLTNGEPGAFALATKGNVKAPTPRREVAQAILKILQEDSFVRQYPLMVRK